MFITLGDLLLYIILLVPLAIWFYVKARYVSRQRRLWNEMISNKCVYGRALAEAISDTKMLEEDYLDKEGAKTLMVAMLEFPQVEDVQRTVAFLKGFIGAIEKDPTILERRDMIKERIVIPLMRQFLYFLAVLDEGIRKTIEQQIKQAEETGQNVEDLIKPMLKTAVDTALTW